jgi:hypothetical protein
MIGLFYFFNPPSRIISAILTAKDLDHETRLFLHST